MTSPEEGDFNCVRNTVHGPAYLGNVAIEFKVLREGGVMFLNFFLAFFLIDFQKGEPLENIV